MVTKGESNLEVGQLVDGALKPVNGTNITALMTNVTSADNKESSCLAVMADSRWLSLALASHALAGCRSTNEQAV